MAETGVYLCDDDLLELAEEFFASGFALLTDDNLETPELRRISSRRELERELKETPYTVRFYLVSPTWERAPLEVKSMTKDGRTIFYHNQENGGPALEIFYGRPFDGAKGKQLRPGCIIYHAKFWNPTTQQMESAPAELVDYYKRLRSKLAKGGRRVKEGPRSFIVTKNADKLGVTLRAFD